MITVTAKRSALKSAVTAAFRQQYKAKDFPPRGTLGTSKDGKQLELTVLHHDAGTYTARVPADIAGASITWTGSLEALKSATKSGPTTTTLSFDADTLTVGGSTVKAMDKVEPVEPASIPTDGMTHAIGTPELHKAVTATKHAVAKDEYQAVFRGFNITLDGIGSSRVTATDGFRLAIRDVELQTSYNPAGRPDILTIEAKTLTPFLMPARSTKAGSTLISVTNDHNGDAERVTLAYIDKFGTTHTLDTPAMQGRYPSVERVIPSVTPHAGTINAPAWLRALEEIKGTLNTFANNRVDITIPVDPLDNATLYTANRDGESVGVIPRHHASINPTDTLEFALNHDYLHDALEAHDSAELDFLMTSSMTAPVQIRSDNLLTMVVPLRAG
jgi:DNA polymerase III sliding clamp (beta) subunit (PCNA family)